MEQESCAPQNTSYSAQDIGGGGLEDQGGQGSLFGDVCKPPKKTKSKANAQSEPTVGQGLQKRDLRVVSLGEIREHNDLGDSIFKCGMGVIDCPSRELLTEEGVRGLLDDPLHVIQAPGGYQCFRGLQSLKLAQRILPRDTEIEVLVYPHVDSSQLRNSAITETLVKPALESADKKHTKRRISAVFTLSSSADEPAIFKPQTKETLAKIFCVSPSWLRWLKTKKQRSGS